MYTIFRTKQIKKKHCNTVKQQLIVKMSFRYKLFVKVNFIFPQIVNKYYKSLSCYLLSLQHDIKLKMNDFALISIVFDTCRGNALLSLEYYRIILTCNMTHSAVGAGHAYPSGAPNVPPGFLELISCFSYFQLI